MPGSGSKGLKNNLYMWKYFSTFFRIGLFTIGGGYAMIPLIHEEVVEKNEWISEEDFLDLLAISQSLPGVFAVNMAIYIGYRLRGMRGALAMSMGAVLPSFLIILSIALFFRRFRGNEVVESVFLGIRPAVVALIAVPVFKLSKASGIGWRTAWIPMLSALLIWLMGVSPVLIIVVAGVSGYLWGRFDERRKA